MTKKCRQHKRRVGVRHLLSGLASGLGFGLLVVSASPLMAQTVPSLGAAQSFAVLASASVANGGASSITGDVGVSAGGTIAGFPPGTFVTGGLHPGDAQAVAALSAAVTTYDDLVGRSCTGPNVLTGQNLGGLVLSPGVYCFASSAQLTGLLTLNASGNPNAVFIFQIGSTLTTASNSAVVVTGGPLVNVFWQVGSSATLGTNTSFAGNILAFASVTVTAGSSVSGRVMARTASVTLDANSVGAAFPAAAPVCPAMTTIALSPTTLPSGTVGVAYSQGVTASGGTGPYTYTISSGAQPSGTTMTTAGLLAGTPSGAASFTFTVRAEDANTCVGSRSYVVVIAAAPPMCSAITLAPSTMPGGTVGASYSQTIVGSGGTGAYTFDVTAGALPASLTLAPGGVLAGTPTAATTANFTVRAMDANMCPGTLGYSIIVAAASPPPSTCPVISIAPETLPVSTVGVPYNQTIVASGGTAPYNFDVTAGALPANITLTSAGVLAGTPTTSGQSTVTVRGTDSNSCSQQRSLTISVATAVPALPQAFVMLLGSGLTAFGYFRLRKRARRD